MYKIVIFNVGGGFSAYAELKDKKVIVDLGSKNNFSPVKNFLMPLANRGKLIKDFNTNLYYIDQLFLSHLDNDHVSEYIEFRNYFHPCVITCPNKNPNQNNDFKINDQLIGEIDDVKRIILEDVNKRIAANLNYPRKSKKELLVSTINEIDLHYIKPKDCERHEVLRSNYKNNISLVLFVNLGHKTMLFPGDVFKEGMEYLINTDPKLRESLVNKGVDYLVTPYHGLETSFSSYFFKTIKGHKAHLNIIPEKIKSEKSNENKPSVDSRYYKEKYSSGLNNLNQRAVKMSMGHVFIHITDDIVTIKQHQDINDIISEFLV